MDYQSVMADLEFRTKSAGIDLGLTRVLDVAERMQNPQDQIWSIHVGGTNGKGSVSRMLQNTLMELGLSVGTYNSPAVFRTWEKIAINGVDIHEAAIVSCYEKVCTAEEAMLLAHAEYGRLTAFECETLMAYQYFAEQKCDCMIIEVGLGGDLDATNIMHATKQLATIITSISLDHVRILGNTTAEIAAHKAGIMRAKVPTYTAGNQDESVRLTLEQAADSCHTTLHIAQTTYPTNLCATYQQTNAALAATVLQGIRVPLQQLVCEEKQELLQTAETFAAVIDKSLQSVYWPGRFEQLQKDPVIILDGAHNLAAAKELRRTIEQQFPKKKCIFVMGVMADKNHGDMLRQLLPLAAVIIPVKPDNTRAMTVMELSKEIREILTELQLLEQVTILPADRVLDALQAALQTASERKEDGMPIICFGSLYYLGEMRNCYDTWKYNLEL